MIIEKKLTTINAWGNIDKQYLYVIDVGHKSQRVLQLISIKGSDIKILKTEIVPIKNLENKIEEFTKHVNRWNNASIEKVNEN